MELKLIIALINDRHTDRVLKAAREAGATGSTVINNARGEGLRPHRTFLGLEMTSQCDVLLFVVERGLADKVLAAINESGRFREESGAGMAFQLEVEKAVGLEGQLEALLNENDDGNS